MGYRFVLSSFVDGEMRELAEEAVRRLDLQDFVGFPGYAPENLVTENFLTSDLFIFQTRQSEGFTNVLFRGVAVGMPIVTT